MALAGALAKPRVVVLGSGWGGFAVAKTLQTSLFDVTLVSPRNHMLFTPLLASTAVGTLDFRSIAEPVRTNLPRVVFEQGKCRGIDLAAQTVTVQVHRDPVHGFDAGEEGTADATIKLHHQLSYDFLVLAVGARCNTFGIPGVQQYAHFLKELADARGIRSSILRAIELACFPTTSPEERKRLLSFVVVGGGPTGVEFAGELHDFLYQDVRRLYPQIYPDIRIRLVEGREILSSFDATLRDWARSRLHSEGVELVKANVKHVDWDKVVLSDGSSIPCGVCVWSTGIAPRKALTLLPPDLLARDRGGRVLTDACLRVKRGDASGATLPNVFSLGDCANVNGVNHPPTAQVAEKQGLHLAKRLNLAALNAAGSVDKIAQEMASPASAFEYRHQGSLAYVGEYGAINDFTQADKQSPVGRLLGGRTVKGIAGWLFWRSAYLTTLGSWRNRLQVPIDWARTFVFGRDINTF